MDIFDNRTLRNRPIVSKEVQIRPPRLTELRISSMSMASFLFDGIVYTTQEPSKEDIAHLKRPRIDLGLTS